MYKNIQEIAVDLNTYKEQIIEVLTEKCWTHFNGYFFIKNNTFELLKNNSRQKLRDDFFWFYDMNGRFGLNEKQKEKFFELFTREEKGLDRILADLHSVPPKKLHLSFATKLLHTLNNKLPIYDSHIVDVLGLPPPTYPSSLERRVEQREDIYQKLGECFSVLLKETEILSFLKEFRIGLKKRADLEHFSWQDDVISDEKLLDSALWALHTVKNKK